MAKYAFPSAVGKKRGKKAGTPSAGLEVGDVRTLSWQLLIALKFLHDKGLAHGELDNRGA